MSDVRLIDANALMKCICGNECGVYPEDCGGMESKTVPCNFYAYVNEAPTIEAEPVKRGKWECVNDDENVWMCTNCGSEISLEAGKPIEFEWVYCPCCGAKMAD